MHRFSGFLTLTVALVVGCEQNASVTPEQTAPSVALAPLVVYQVVPNTEVNHGVEWITGLASKRQNTPLTGPRWYVTELDPASDATEVIRFNGYELPAEMSPPTSQSIQLQPADLEEKVSVELGGPTHFLQTTQRLQEGSPADVPPTLSRFVAYPITSTDVSWPQDAAIFNEKQVALSNPAYVLLPAEEWHHDDHYPVVDPDSCWIVFAATPDADTEKVSTLDEFGLNSLELNSLQWVCLPTKWSK